MSAPESGPCEAKPCPGRCDFHPWCWVHRRQINECIRAKDEEAARLRAALDVERLASLIHDEWVSWSKELASKEKLLGSERVERWKSLWVPYAELSETMKEHDREWARKVRGYEASKSTREQAEGMGRVVGSPASGTPSTEDAGPSKRELELEKFREEVFLAFHMASEQRRPFFAGQRLRRLIREAIEHWNGNHP
jgi:hypothetical protein